jgi:type I restriction enzyme S subunit
MSEWSEKKWGEIAELKYGKSLKDYHLKTAGIPVYGTNGPIGFTERALYEKPSVIVGRKGAYRGVHYCDTSFFVIDTAFYLVPKIKELDILFAYYQLQTVDINAMDSGSAIPSTSREDFYEIDILLPPLLEQERIAEVLKSIDDKIDLLHKQNKTLEEMAETLFRQWFVEEAEEDWEEVNLGSAVKTILGGTPSTEKKEYWGGSIAWINSGEVNKERIIKPTKFITELGLKNSNTKLLPKKSTVIAITGATMGQVSFLEIDTCANQSVVGLIPNEVFYPEYLHLLVKNHIEDMVQNETGGAQPHINKNDINNTIIKLPSRNILSNAKKDLEDLYSKVANNCWQILQLETLRDTLLPKLMSGLVTVNEIA